MSPQEQKEFQTQYSQLPAFGLFAEIERISKEIGNLERAEETRKEYATHRGKAYLSILMDLLYREMCKRMGEPNQ